MRVTVATPTFNRAGYLRETIDSILSQTLQDFRYVVVDDGSEDGTRDLVAGYGDRIEYLYQSNAGEAAAINRAWRLADTEYFAVVSSDDPVMANWLEVAVEYMDAHPDRIVGYPDWRMIDDHGAEIRKVRVYDYSAERLYGWLHCLPGPGALIRRSALDSLAELRDANLRHVSDLACWMRLGLEGDLVRIPHELARWRLHDEALSVSAEPVERSAETINLVDAFFSSDSLPVDVARHETQARSRAHYLASVFLRHEHVFRSAVHYLRSRSLKLSDAPDLPVELRRRGPLSAIVEKLSGG